jgi:hypothetical protein
MSCGRARGLDYGVRKSVKYGDSSEIPAIIDYQKQ